MNEAQTKQGRYIPQNDLDFQLSIVNSQWGQLDVSPQLRNRLKFTVEENHKKGDITVNKEGIKEEYLEDVKVNQEFNYWELLSFYTRDFRLANLSKQEMEFCVNRSGLASDLISENMPKAFAALMGQVAPYLELSQSKDGWLRENLNKLTMEQRQQVLEPPKKDFFGRTKK